MTPQDVLARAHSCLGHRVAYVLGMGGFNPLDAFPFATPEKGCDCSGFAMWALGMPREVGGTWYGTDQMVADATGPGLIFAAVHEAAPGDLLVYAHQAAGHHGHVGVVVEVQDGKPTQAIHCSLGNFKVTGDAIQQGGTGLWTMLPTSIIARCKALTEAPPA